MDINVNGAIVSKSSCLKYLGADLDECMSLKAMINRKRRVAMGNLQKLVLIIKSLTLDAATTVALGLVISDLEYANALYSGLTKSEIRKLQRIQSMAAKVVTGVTKFDSSTAALKSLHWLPIHLRIKFKVLSLVFRAVHKLAPAYLTELYYPRYHQKRRFTLTVYSLYPLSPIHKAQDIRWSSVQCTRTKILECLAGWLTLLDGL